MDACPFFQDYSYMQECAIGFSGVLFALKVLFIRDLSCDLLSGVVEGNGVIT